MDNMDTVFTKESIISALEKTHQEVAAFFGSSASEMFFQRQGESWSLSENLEHLIRSIKPVAKAMRLPKVSLRLLFGAPAKPSGKYDDVKQAYLKELAKGAQASGQYLPKSAGSATNLPAAQTELLEKWKKASSDLIHAIQGWTDTELDQYVLPHPILGKLTVRELLFFTIYHDMRHMTAEGD